MENIKNLIKADRLSFDILMQLNAIIPNTKLVFILYQNGSGSLSLLEDLVLYNGYSIYNEGTMVYHKDVDPTLLSGNVCFFTEVDSIVLNELTEIDQIPGKIVILCGYDSSLTEHESRSRINKLLNKHFMNEENSKVIILQNYMFELIIDSCK